MPTPTPSPWTASLPPGYSPRQWAIDHGVPPNLLDAVLSGLMTHNIYDLGTAEEYVRMALRNDANPVTPPTPLPTPLPPGALPTPPPPGASSNTGGAGSAYQAIVNQLPGYGLISSVWPQSIGSAGHGFGVPGFENNIQQAGGSWAGTQFMPNGPSRNTDVAMPGTDYYNGPPPPGTGGMGGAGGTGTNNIFLGPLDPGGSFQRAPLGYGWFKEGGEGTTGTWILKNIDGTNPATNQGGGTQTNMWNGGTATGGTGGTGGTAPGSSSAAGFKINAAKPWQTTWYSQTYGNQKPPPFGHIHEQIGKSLEGVPAAMPGFAWAGPQAMAASQPGATGTPPGGWTQMLGYTPGAPANYGFQGNRPNPYGIVQGATPINPTR